MRIMTKKEYAEEKKISMQAVTSALNSGKLKEVELDMFVEYEGKKFKIGKKKVLRVED